MIRDDIPFNELWERLSTNPFLKKSVAAFIQFLEKRLGVKVSYATSSVPFEAPELADLTLLAENMRAKGIIHSYYPASSPPDEPPVYQWGVEYAANMTGTAGGSSIESERAALVAALAEATERHVWETRDDYFVSPLIATSEAAAKKGSRIDPRAFAGFSSAQRAGNADLEQRPASEYLWVRGHSWTEQRPLLVPAQVANGNPHVQQRRRDRKEPLLLHSITHGLSTRPGRHEAVLYGALEIIERDAYAIMWLNQLSLPRFDLSTLAARRPTLAKLLERCKRYRLEPHAVRLLSDAPTYAVMAVLKDTTGNLPIIAVGLRADRDAAKAVEKALLEALRVRRGVRHKLSSVVVEWNPEREAKDIGHSDRLLYWTVGNRAERLKFMLAGPVQNFSEPWEKDSDEEHLERIIKWCRARRYEMASVSLTRSAGNITPWHIEMVVMPQMQPLHLAEKNPYIGGERLTEIPQMFGYAPLTHPYVDYPHPFA